MNTASIDRSTRTEWPSLAFCHDVDRYGVPASRYRRRLAGCECAVPCLGFRCREPGCESTDLTPWCRGAYDALPDGCDDCWNRLDQAGLLPHCSDCGM